MATKIIAPQAITVKQTKPSESISKGPTFPPDRGANSANHPVYDALRQIRRAGFVNDAVRDQTAAGTDHRVDRGALVATGCSAPTRSRTYFGCRRPPWGSVPAPSSPTARPEHAPRTVAPIPTAMRLRFAQVVVCATAALCLAASTAPADNRCSRRRSAPAAGPEFPSFYKTWTHHGSPLVDHLPIVPGIPTPRTCSATTSARRQKLTYYDRHREVLPRARRRRRRA